MIILTCIVAFCCLMAIISTITVRLRAVKLMRTFDILVVESSKAFMTLGSRMERERILQILEDFDWLTSDGTNVIKLIKGESND
jgi:hypothetical protein